MSWLELLLAYMIAGTIESDREQGWKPIPRRSQEMCLYLGLLERLFEVHHAPLWNPHNLRPVNSLDVLRWTIFATLLPR
jgi:hypothetical protein